mmetsp:Transcript_3020/g.6843  ORF Transcript_3020/g.6843 Transcript_3020/m.6843 type:complete len:288 (-) Transcript_3020:272-1135(-)
MTSRLAAPARPTLTITGRTRALLAKFWILLGIVAEKRSVCRCLVKKSMALRTSSSKFGSPMRRSASSRQRYLHSVRLNLFLVSMSLRRPGVHTAMWNPWRTTSICALIACPPMQQRVRNAGSPAAVKPCANMSATSFVCRASSREGQMMMPNGPSPRAIGIRFSSSNAIITIGSANVSVFPEPVKAMPIMSLPASTAGKPWIWMGVGFLMPFSCRVRRIGSGKRMSLNDLIGGGMSSPSTRMCHLSRIPWHSSSLILRMCEGGRQPVDIESLYSTPLASSLTDISGL